MLYFVYLLNFSFIALGLLEVVFPDHSCELRPRDSACLTYSPGYNNQKPLEFREGLKSVNLWEHGYPVMMTCSLPEQAEVIKQYESYEIKLTNTISIESIAWYPKSDYDYDSKQPVFRTAESMYLALLNKMESRIPFHPNLRIVDQFDHGLYAIDSTKYKKLIRLYFFFESDEMVYEVKCEPIFEYHSDVAGQLIEIIQNMKPVQYCYKDIPKRYPLDSIYDFSEKGYGFQMALPPTVEIRTKKEFPSYRLNHSDYDLVLENGMKYISLYQYQLPNKIDESFSRKKNEVENDSRFVQWIYNDEQGYLAEMTSSAYEQDQYELYHYYQTDNFYYVFESCRENKSFYADLSIQPLTLALAEDAYSRVKEVAIGRICN